MESPSFLLGCFLKVFKELYNGVKIGSHQYARAFGALPYVQAIGTFHGIKEPQSEIVTTKGGVEALFDCFMALINPGDEVILFDPSYDCYRPQVQMAGGSCVGVPLKPKYQQHKSEINVDAYTERDLWTLDAEALSSAFTAKTKIIVINSPHNPVGKVFTEHELNTIATIIQKHPQVIIVQDNVYQGMYFDGIKSLPKLSQRFRARAVSIYSAGKIFSATGVRSGWVEGSAQLIRLIRSVHQYNVFCDYNLIEGALAECFTAITTTHTSYLTECAAKLAHHRGILLKQLVRSKYDMDLWVPQGGYFVIADISRVPIKEQYMIDQNMNPRTKDFAFAMQLAYEDRVVCIPCSPFYDKSNQEGQKYVRFAFCKDLQLLEEAGRRMRNQK